MILDNSDTDNPDFYFPSLLFMESFTSPAAVLNIHGVELKMPLDWSVAIGDGESGCELEIVPLTSLNDRGFNAFSFNPLSSFTHEFLPIEITNVYNEVTWFAPRTKINQLITVPIKAGKNPVCLFFIRDFGKNCDLIDHFKLL